MSVLNKIEAILRVEMVSTLSGFEWVQAYYTGKFDAPKIGSSALSYLNEHLELSRPFYIDGDMERVYRIPRYREVHTLLSEYYIECQQSGTPWNEAKFIMDREGNIEHSFVMNWQRVFQDKIDMIHTAASGLAELVYEHLSNVLPDDSVWEAGSALLTVREGKVAFSYSITIGGVPQTQPLSTRFPRMWLEYYTLVNEGELKGHFPAWNTILLDLPFEESDFDLDRHVRYEVQ
jgi:hypothetical protein